MSYTISPARYARNMFAVHVEPDGSGFKTRTDRIVEWAQGKNKRYSHREQSYILSASQIKKFEAKVASGEDVPFRL